MSKSPKPAPGGADAHRRDDDGENDPAPAATPGGFGDGDGGGGGGGAPPSSSSGMSAIPMRKVAIAGAAIIGAYLLYRYAQKTDAVQVERDVEEGGQEPDGGQPKRGVSVDQNGNPIIPDDPEDPLKADHEAGRWVFGDMGWGSD
jgi:hypothetical protein